MTAAAGDEVLLAAGIQPLASLTAWRVIVSTPFAASAKGKGPRSAKEGAPTVW